MKSTEFDFYASRLNLVPELIYFPKEIGDQFLFYLYIPKILHCASFCRSFVAHMGRILDMKALLTNNTKVFISSSNDKSIKVCENETDAGASK